MGDWGKQALRAAVLAVCALVTEACDHGDSSRLAADRWVAGGLAAIADTGCPVPVVVWADADGDGYGDERVPAEVCGAAVGFVDNALDCDDLRADVSPEGSESCGDGLDNDCSGGDEPCAAPTLAEDAAQLVTPVVSDEFGSAVVGHLVGGRMAVGRGAAPTADGLWKSGQLDVIDTAGLAAGATSSLEESRQGIMVGAQETQLGRALAGLRPGRGDAATAVAAGLSGPLEVDGITYAGGVALLDPSLSGTTDIAGGAEALLLLEPVGSRDGTNGVEVLAAGFSDPGGPVLAANRSSFDRVYVALEVDGTARADLASGSVVLTSTTDDFFGSALGWGDMNGDGLADLAVGAQQSDTDTGSGELTDAGRVDVFSGDELAALPLNSELDPLSVGLGLRSSRDNENLGTAIAWQDMDGDGLDDVLVGSFEEGTTSLAAVTVLSVGPRDDWAGQRLEAGDVPSGAAVTRIDGELVGDFFGYSLAPLSGERPGVAVSAPLWSASGDVTTVDGAVYVLPTDASLFSASAYSVADVMVARIEAEQSGEALGLSLASAGPVDDPTQDALWVVSQGVVSAEARAALVFRTGL